MNSEDRGYLYDAAWNLSKRTNNGTAYTFTVDSKTQLSSESGMTDYYDSNGNLSSRVLSGNADPDYIYSYDAENQLISIENWSAGVPQRRSDFAYDGRGRLRKRLEYLYQSSDWQLVSETRYVLDGMRVIQERDGSNNPLVAYTRGSDLSGSFEGAGGIGGLLARSHQYSSGTPTNHNYYHADGNGNITYMVNSSQSMVASYRYDPFGNTISSSGALASANVYRFSSKELIGALGLYYYGYRFYDPNLQRWPNRDPLFEEEGFGTLHKVAAKSDAGVFIHEGVNLYAYVQNDPTMAVDPFGLASAPGGVGTIGIANPENAEAIAAALGYDSAAAMNAARAAALACATIGSAQNQEEKEDKEKLKEKCKAECYDTYENEDVEFCKTLRTRRQREYCYRQAFKRYAKCVHDCSTKYK